MLVIIKFKITGTLAFLSHIETMRLFQRAAVRADIHLRYSQGFNPRPKISLPLPRTVAVESHDDLLCIYLDSSAKNVDAKKLKKDITKQLPDECEILEIKVTDEKTPVAPKAVTYVLPLKTQHLSDQLKSRANDVMKKDTIIVERTAKLKPRKVEVRNYLKSIEFTDQNVIVNCNITPTGAIRVDEILTLLELDQEKLNAPIARRSVQW